MRFANAVQEAVEEARRGGFGAAGKGPGQAFPPTVIVGVGDPPEVPYLVGPPGDRDLLVVRYRATAPVTASAPETASNARVANTPPEVPYSFADAMSAGVK